MKYVIIYLFAGIVSRVIFFAIEELARKKYGFGRYVEKGFWFELVAHALDVLVWPYSTIFSFTVLSREIEKTKKSRDKHAS